MKRALITLLAAGSLTIANTKAGVLTLSDLSPEEQALFDKGKFVEMYETDQHSRHEIGSLEASGHKTKHGFKVDNNEQTTTLLLIFGMEDAEVAREEGRDMAAVHYTRAMVNQFLFAQGWDKYHDRFFTRAYVQEGTNAYEKALK